MDSCPAPNAGKTPRREKRSRPDPVNRIARAKARTDYEKVDPKPVAHLGPVPPVAEQMRELMTNPAWVMARMRENQEDLHQEPILDEAMEEWMEIDEEPEMFTGYELVDMEPIPIPETTDDQKEVVHKSTDGQTPPEGSGQAVEAVGDPPPSS